MTYSLRIWSEYSLFAVCITCAITYIVFGLRFAKLPQINLLSLFTVICDLKKPCNYTLPPRTPTHCLSHPMHPLTLFSRRARCRNCRRPWRPSPRRISATFARRRPRRPPTCRHPQKAGRARNTCFWPRFWPHLRARWVCPNFWPPWRRRGRHRRPRQTWRPHLTRWAGNICQRSRYWRLHDAAVVEWVCLLFTYPPPPPPHMHVIPHTYGKQYNYLCNPHCDALMGLQITNTVL